MDKLTLVLAMFTMYLCGIATVFATMGILKDRENARVMKMFEEVAPDIFKPEKKPTTLKKLKSEQEKVVPTKVKK